MCVSDLLCPPRRRRVLISIRFLAAALAFAGLASCTSDTTGVVPTSGSLRATSPPVTPSGGATASPSIQAIEAACAALDVQVKILAKALHGKQPITDNVEGDSRWQLGNSRRRLAVCKGPMPRRVLPESHMSREVWGTTPEPTSGISSIS